MLLTAKAYAEGAAPCKFLHLLLDKAHSHPDEKCVPTAMSWWPC